jgi:4-hydroxy-tetrahydrodipicolinate reductase
MKIAIVGYGKMGQMVARCALERRVEIVSIIDPFHPDAGYRTFSEEAMAGVEVCICFTEPSVAFGNIDDVCRYRKQAVIGTTGWTDRMPEVERMVGDAGIGLIYSSNFSLGVNLFFRVVELTAEVFDKFDVYDVLAWEAHHRLKLDSPSGTARTLAGILLDKIQRKTRVFEDRLDRRIEPEELHVASMRGGSIPGTHAVLFDSEFDTIELKHTARNRLGFATGAIVAAEWVRKQTGLFTEIDMMRQLL